MLVSTVRQGAQLFVALEGEDEGVEAPAEPGLKHDNFATRLPEEQHGHVVEILKVGRKIPAGP